MPNSKKAMSLIEYIVTAKVKELESFKFSTVDEVAYIKSALDEVRNTVYDCIDK